VAWHFVSSRKLQPGQLYGVWLTTTGDTSTDELVTWLANKGWNVTTIWARRAEPKGQQIKEVHAVWTGQDGTVLPSDDPRVQYGALYISDLGATGGEAAAVPERAPGEGPPLSPEVLARLQRPPPRTGRWQLPAVLAAAALAMVTVISGRPGRSKPPEPPLPPPPPPTT
jgi:hypothetical protein